MSSLHRHLRARRAEASEPRTRRERGAAALEFALIAPLFFLVVFGGIEIGFMFRNNLALQDSVRSAARVASVERNDVDADLAIISKLNARVGELNGKVTRIVIFAPESLSGEVHPDCIAPLAVSNENDERKCNVYDVSDGDIQALVDSFTPGALHVKATGIDNVTERSANNNIGIYVEYDYEYVTGFFNTLTLSSTSVQAIELAL